MKINNANDSVINERILIALMHLSGVVAQEKGTSQDLVFEYSMRYIQTGEEWAEGVAQMLDEVKGYVSTYEENKRLMRSVSVLKGDIKARDNLDFKIGWDIGAFCDEYLFDKPHAAEELKQIVGQPLPSDTR